MLRRWRLPNSKIRKAAAFQNSSFPEFHASLREIPTNVVNISPDIQPRCPICGREVRSLRCGHCGSRLPSWQADLYGTTIKKLAKMGGNRPDATNKEGIPTGAADEELPKDKGINDDLQIPPTPPSWHNFKRPFPDGLKSDEYYTPDYGFELLRPYLPEVGYNQETGDASKAV